MLTTLCSLPEYSTMKETRVGSKVDNMGDDGMVVVSKNYNNKQNILIKL